MNVHVVYFNTHLENSVDNTMVLFGFGVQTFLSKKQAFKQVFFVVEMMKGLRDNEIILSCSRLQTKTLADIWFVTACKSPHRQIMHTLCGSIQTIFY